MAKKKFNRRFKLLIFPVILILAGIIAYLIAFPPSFESMTNITQEPNVCTELEKECRFNFKGSQFSFIRESDDIFQDVSHVREFEEFCRNDFDGTISEVCK